MRVALNFAAVGARHGSAEKYVGMLARSLWLAGHDVHVLAERVDPCELPRGVEVHRVRPRVLPGFGWLQPYRFAAASARELDRYQFDLVIGFSNVWRQDVCIAITGCRRALLDDSQKRIRSPWTRALWRAGTLASPKQWVYHWIERKQFRGGSAPFVIAPSRRVAEDFRRWHDLDDDRLGVVHLGTELDPIADEAGARETFRSLCGLHADDVAVLFAARDYSHRGIEPLLESWVRVARACPNARLLVCGSNREGYYRRRASRMGLDGRVQFLGYVNDVRECLAAADVFVLPTFYDTCSLMVLEALTAGVPVVTTRAEGAADLVSDGVNGYLVDSPWASDQLSNRLQRLILDAQMRRRMGQQARIRAPRLTIDASVRKTLETIVGFIRRRNRRARRAKAA